MPDAARLVRPLAVRTAEDPVADLLGALRDALSGAGPALAPHPDDRPPNPAAGPGAPLGHGEDDAHDPTAVVLSTSGSTGDPKAALLPASALLAGAAATHDRLGGPGVWVLAVPAHTVAGVMVCVRAMTTGTRPAVCELTGGFRPEAFAAAVATAQQAARTSGGRVYTALVPTQVARLLDAGGRPLASLASLDAVLVGGGPVPARVLHRAGEAGAALIATYGTSETAGGCVYDGRPLDGVQVDVTGEGLLRVSGDVVARGYRSHPGHPAFAVTGGGRRSFTTDDLGRVDGGVVEVLGRADDVLVSGGYKIAPHVVADALRAVPGVADAAVVGVPDDEWGQRVCAAVVLERPGAAEGPGASEIRADVSRALGRWAAPDVRVVAELPMLSAGKVDRQALRALFEGP